MHKRKLSESFEDGAPKTKRTKLDQTLDTTPTRCSFASLPMEIISEHIFNYIGFKIWLDTLVLVCKQWRLAAQTSTVHKQLRVSADLKRSPSLIATYNVNALVLEPESMNMSTLVQFITASPKLNTVVLSRLRCVDDVTYVEWVPTLHKEPYKPEVAFPNVKTLSIEHVGLLALFPSVTRLKIELLWRDYDGRSPGVQYPSVQEVEVSIPYRSCLPDIVQVFPNVKKIYLSTLNNNGISKDIESNGKEYGVEVIYIDVSDDSKTMSYLDYFNAFGYTRLQQFINARDKEKVKDTLLKYTSRAYEKDLIEREPQFTFPTRSMDFVASPTKIKKQILSAPMLLYLIEKGFYNYWTVLRVKPQELIRQADKYMPISPEALKTTVTLHGLGWLNDKKIAQHFEEFIKTLATLKDRNGNTLLHLLARKERALIRFWDQLIKHSDLHALNNEQENAATIAFHSCNWGYWRVLIDLGVPIQCAKYAEDLSSTSSLLSWFITQAMPLSFLHQFTDQRYIQVLFFELQKLKSSRKPLVFRELIQLGADPTRHNHKGQSLLNILVEEPTNELMSIWYCLVAFDLDLDEYDGTGRTPLITAIQLGNIKKIDFLLQKGADANATGVKANGKKIYPVKMQQTVADGKVIALLAEHGADFTIEDVDGNTILNATIAKHMSVDIKTLATLVPINKPNKHNMTPLAKSICIGNLTKVQACVASGADVNQISGPLMQSPLLLALEGSDQLKVQSIVQCLLETQKVDVTLRDKAGRSFVNYSLRTEPLLEPSSAIIDIVMKAYATPENIAFVKSEVETTLNNPHMLHFVTKLLKYAIVNIQCVQFFVTVLGIDTNIQDSNGDTMLSLIDFHPHKSPPVIDFLVSHGANVNHQNKQNNTPLMKAMDIITVKSSGHVKELLRHGASVELKNIWGLAPIDIDPTIRTIK